MGPSFTPSSSHTGVTAVIPDTHPKVRSAPTTSLPSLLHIPSSAAMSQEECLDCIEALVFSGSTMDVLLLLSSRQQTPAKDG